MALERRRIQDVPKDAIILTEDQALQYQTKILNNWNTPSDIFAYKYGSVFLGTATMLAGAYTNNFFRRKFKVTKYGQVSSYLPISVVPAMMSLIFHHQFVLKYLVLENEDTCPVCMEVRASSLQAVTGTILPLILAPLSTISLVHKYGTYNIPYLTKEPMKVTKLLIEKVRPAANTFFWMLVAQAVLGSVVTFFEADSIFKVKYKLRKLEQEFEHQN
ncbi:unnamed protein product [Callosobruchus maculatus]|uniref:Transmembrane protein 126A n=1 Tax=Callosobruchus maculatus TaxID=64391 RepID=A0A653D1L9_CALMS|nr:unnamed protein product [Callosobruchus maculatus]